MIVSFTERDITEIVGQSSFSSISNSTVGDMRRKAVFTAVDRSTSPSVEEYWQRDCGFYVATYEPDLLAEEKKINAEHAPASALQFNLCGLTFLISCRSISRFI